MSQQHLTSALATIEALEKITEGDIKQQIAALRESLVAAQRAGEGQDAEELRQTLAQRNEETAKFISVMVHEIRKPLTSIRGYSDMLGKNVMGPLNEMQAQFVDTIRKNSISMEQLVTDISDMSKLQAGRIIPNPKMEMYKNVAMQLEKDLTEPAKERGITLVFETPQGLPLLNLDGTRVEQALRKLIDNAVKYTPEGGGTVTIRAEGRGNALHIFVVDKGVGISTTDQARLGELFFRGDQELVTQTKGYGLGLPIALACLKLVGGELRWTSQINEGSTFEVILPAMS